MKMRQTILLAGAVLALAACGKVGPLEPAAGQRLPVKPLMARETPTPEDLLAFDTQARPERIDELLRRSQPRKADPFDLPPPDASLAPTSATEETEPAAATTGPDNAEEPR
jgi:predicted small lipoprotein YifL